MKWSQPTAYKYRLLKTENPITGIENPSYSVETVILYHLPNHSDIYNYIRQINFNDTEVVNYPYQFNSKTTEYASS